MMAMRSSPGTSGASLALAVLSCRIKHVWTALGSRQGLGSSPENVRTEVTRTYSGELSTASAPCNHGHRATPETMKSTHEKTDTERAGRHRIVDSRIGSDRAGRRGRQDLVQ